jgi:hypothetical protein
MAGLEEAALHERVQAPAFIGPDIVPPSMRSPEGAIRPLQSIVCVTPPPTSVDADSVTEPLDHCLML